MDSSRKVAFLALLEIDKNQAFSNLVLNKLIEKENPENPAFARELVYGVLKNRLYIDNIIDNLARSGVKKIKSRELNILRLGVYQIKFLESVPDYAAVDESVKLAKKYAHGKDKFVNGALRNLIRSKDQDYLPSQENEIDYLSIKYSFSAWIIALWKKEYSLEKIQSILKASNETPELIVRVNSMITDRDALARELEVLDYEVKKSEMVDTALICKGSNLIETDQFKDGKFSIQDEVSQIAVKTIDAKPQELILDMCAAPGGKTLAMAETMNNQGKILAFDIYQHKLDLIEKNAKRLNIKNIKTKCQNSSKIDRKYIDSFQKVLCDVPCSGLGVIRRKPEIKLKDKPDLESLYEIQSSILENGAKYLKVGGVLVYSTCTINKEENENQIQKFLKTNGNFELEWSKQFLPDEDETDGFYIAKLIRKK